MPGFVAHAFYLSTWEAIAGLYKFRAGLVYIHSMFQAIQSYIERTCLERKKQRRINA